MQLWRGILQKPVLLSLLSTAGLWVWGQAPSGPAGGPRSAESTHPKDPVLNFEYVWSRLDRNYGQFGPKRVDWDALHRVYRAKVTPATTDEQLWRVLMTMLGHLNDAHVCLQAGPRRECGGLFEGVKPQGLSRDLVKSKYLHGKATEAINGKVTFGWLTPDVGYLHIFDFKGSPDPLYQAVDAAVAQFATARALVVDVRHNTGGTGRTAEAVAGRFADTKRHFMRIRTRYGVEHDDLLATDHRNVMPSGPAQFTKPTVLLTDRFTASAAELFTLAMRVQPHVTVVGDLTEGAFSAQFPDPMPNGWTLWVSFHRATDHNGINWDGIGIPPDLRIVNNAADVAAGIDRPIEFSLDLLEKGTPSPQDESSSLANLKTSVVQTYLETAREKGAAAAEAEIKRLRADRSGRYFFAPDEALQQVGPLLGRKQYSEAIALLLATLDEFPKFRATYAMLARAYLGSGNLAAAEAIMARGENLEPMHPMEVTQFEAAKAAIRKQKYGSAAADLEKALAGGDLASADRAFQDLLAKRDRGGPVFDEDDFVALGYKLLKAKHVEQALFVLEHTVKLYPGSWNAWDSLGEVAAEAGRMERAITCYRKSLALSPGNQSGRARLEALEKQRKS